MNNKLKKILIISAIIINLLVIRALHAYPINPNILDPTIRTFGINLKYEDFSRSTEFFYGYKKNISFKNNGAKRLEKVQFCEGLTIPWSGGAYFRLIPSPLFKAGIIRAANVSTHLNFTIKI